MKCKEHTSAFFDLHLRGRAGSGDARSRRPELVHSGSEVDVLPASAVLRHLQATAAGSGW